MQATDMGTYIGHRRGSPLNSGRTRTWRDYHVLSVASVALRLVPDGLGTANEMVEEEAAQREGDMEGRYVRLSRWCILWETSFES